MCDQSCSLLCVTIFSPFSFSSFKKVSGKSQFTLHSLVKLQVTQCTSGSYIPFSFGVGEMSQVNHTVPSGSPTVSSLPKSPDRPCSTSPFAPSAADLPSMPEPALTSRVNEAGEDWGPEKGLGDGTEGLGRDIFDSHSCLRRWASHTHG